MALPKEELPFYTYEDYKTWQGDWELIKGIPFALVSPNLDHQRVVAKILYQLIRELENCRNCEAVPDTDYIIDEHTVLRPDIAVICNEKGEKITRAPKIIFEVVSKSTAKVDEITKKKIYEEEGVNYYVLVYPSLKKAKIYKLEEEKYKKIADVENETVEFTFENCKIKLDFSKILDV